MPTPTVTEAWRILKAYGVNHFYKLKETNAFDYTDSLTVNGNEFGDSAYKMFDDLWENKENDDASYVAPSVSRQTDKGKEKAASSAPQHTASQDNNELGDKTVRALNVHRQSKGF